MNKKQLDELGKKLRLSVQGDDIVAALDGRILWRQSWRDLVPQQAAAQVKVQVTPKCREHREHGCKSCM